MQGSSYFFSEAGEIVEKLLPQNIEAECGVLGSIIIDPEAIVQVSDFLRADDFYRDAHRTIYEVILQLYEEHEPADFITICDELERRNQLEDVGRSQLYHLAHQPGSHKWQRRVLWAHRRALLQFCAA